MTAWLKYYYPAEFMAAVLSMQDTPEKIAKYVDVCESKLNIAVKTPDINISGIDFTPDGNSILYGLSSVKSVGAAAVPVIIEHRPYADVADAVARLPKKAFNKRIGENLIKAGAFDFEDENRFSLLNSFYDARKDKKVQRYAVNAYSEDDVIEMEKEALGSPITYKPWWDGIAPNSRVVVRGSIRETHERTDRRGRLMAFPNLVINKCEVSGLIFASNYAKCALEIDAHYLQQYDYEFEFVGKKDDKGKFIINSVQAVRKEEDAA